MNRNLLFCFKYLSTLVIASMFYLHAIASDNRLSSIRDSVIATTNIVTISEGSRLVECYPNPAISYINFRFDKSIAHTSKLYIFSFTGKQMNVFNITDNIIKVPLDNYYRGIYMYQLRDANGNIQESGKFQIKN